MTLSFPWSYSGSVWALLMTVSDQLILPTVPGEPSPAHAWQSLNRHSIVMHFTCHARLHFFTIKIMVIQSLYIWIWILRRAGLVFPIFVKSRSVCLSSSFFLLFIIGCTCMVVNWRNSMLWTIYPGIWTRSLTVSDRQTVQTPRTEEFTHILHLAKLTPMHFYLTSHSPYDSAPDPRRDRDHPSSPPACPPLPPLPSPHSHIFLTITWAGSHGIRIQVFGSLFPNLPTFSPGWEPQSFPVYCVDLILYI